LEFPKFALRRAKPGTITVFINERALLSEDEEGLGKYEMICSLPSVYTSRNNTRFINV